MKTRPTPRTTESPTTTAAKANPAQAKRPLKKRAIKRSEGAKGGLARAVPLLLEHFPGPELERVALEVFCPGAREVFVAGSFNGWDPASTPLRPQWDGRWTVELILRRGKYEYRFLVDGQWTDDPLSPAYVSNPFGGLNCILAV
ncbi:MAG: glycogen-binding domain-containing protein [Limisphaerales bacterium]